MPIINGQKMACAPCIRGHRSTKCNHFYERVMVPVRKPGRPLSNCPCPPGRPCACGGVRVAIPKKQKCGCPSEAADETDEPETKQSPAETPTTPSRPSFRVGKPNGTSRANGRKHSFDPSALERMDSRMINLMPAPGSNGVTNGLGLSGSPVLSGSQADLTGFGAGLGALPAPSSVYASPQQAGFVSPIPYDLGFQYASPHHLSHGIKLEDGLYTPSNGSFGGVMPPLLPVNGNHAQPPLGNPAPPSMPAPKANGVTSGGGCCGSKAKAPPPPSNGVQVPQQGYGQQYTPQPPAVSSCCASKAQKPVQANPTPQQMFGQPYMPHFQFPTVFRYPGDYGSWQHPIDPMIWQQVAAQSTMPLSTPMSPATNGDAVDAGASHQCSCGEGCQCVGCLAHPFNAQMFQYVNNAYSGSNESSPQADAAAGGNTQTAVAAGQDSPAEALTPAVSEGSPPKEEQSLSSLDYFFVNLPISGLCGGSLESCPCGDSCDCPGCMVHHVPLHQG